MIVGICGQAGSGKDTVADYIVTKGYTKVSLADPIKRFARDTYGFSDEQLWGSSEKRNEPDRRYYVGSRREPGGLIPSYAREYLTPRAVLQFVGTEVARALYPDTWVEYLVRVCSTLMQNKGDNRFMYAPESGIWLNQWAAKRRVGVVVPDVRFLNEVHFIWQSGGFVLRLTRPGTGLAGSAGQHASETELLGIPSSKFDAAVDNCGTLPELFEKIDSVLVAVQQKRDEENGLAGRQD